MYFKTDIATATERNKDFRRVLFTGNLSQLVIMSIPPGEDIGEEVHEDVEQTLTCVSGHGLAELDDEERSFGPGDTVVVSPGTAHNFINTGKKPLKLFTVYAPPNHIDGRVHHTKADAEADIADEEFGKGR